MSKHDFSGKWITTEKMADLTPINVYHKELDLEAAKRIKEANLYFNEHILFRRKFELDKSFENATLYISADDYYKLYINGEFVSQGPAPAYPFAYNYNTIDVTKYLKPGKNTIAVHTLYQGLINRVWVSGDNQHGLIMDLCVDGQVVLSSDTDFLVKNHSGYIAHGTTGYDTQFLEEYDSNSSEVGFEKPDFDDSSWNKAFFRTKPDYKLVPQRTKPLVFEDIAPSKITKMDNKLIIDFGGCYVGYFKATAKGNKGDKIIVRCGMELESDGSVRYKMLANCDYEETWVLSGKEDFLDWYDYKPLRYVELVVPENCKVDNINFNARHYPFELKTGMRSEFADDEDIKRIWDLCTNSQKYGVQEVIHDCMGREKGFYLGDGSYTTIVNTILTGDDSMARCLIDSAINSTHFTECPIICLNCSFMQNFADFPLILISAILWHYRLTNDLEYLRRNYKFACDLLNYYSREFEKDLLLTIADRNCVVEWPQTARDGYAAKVVEGTTRFIETHSVINAYFIEAVSTVNKMAEVLGEKPYRDVKPLRDKYIETFYDKENHVFKDCPSSDHSSYISNIFAFAFRLYPDEVCLNTLREQIRQRGLASASIFAGVVLLYGMARDNNMQGVKDMLLEEGAWKRMLREGATTTFEVWGRDLKWNTSLFHLAMTYGALFIADTDLKKLFE